jgi:hypothetical protein
MFAESPRKKLLDLSAQDYERLEQKVSKRAS